MKIIPCIFLAAMFSLSSCVHYRDCFLYQSLSLNYVGFDSTDFSTVYIQKYKNCCGFDSLISVDTVYFTDLGIEIKDTTNIFFHPAGQTSYEHPDYNLKIILHDNREIHLSNFLFENKKCNAHETEPKECWCWLKSVDINAVNCIYIKGAYSNYYIQK